MPITINVYRIADGLVTCNQEVWESVAQFDNHHTAYVPTGDYYDDDRHFDSLNLRGWPDTRAMIIKGNAINGLARALPDMSADISDELAAILE